MPLLDHALETLVGAVRPRRRAGRLARPAGRSGRPARPRICRRAPNAPEVFPAFADVPPTRWCSRCSGARRRSSRWPWPATCGSSRRPAPRARARSRRSRAASWGWCSTRSSRRKMFRDLRAGILHAGIFWGFVLLTVGTANIVTGGLIQAVISIPFDGALWAAVSAMQNVVAVIVLVVDRVGVRAAARLAPAAAHLQPRRAAHPGDDRRRRRDRAARPGVRGRRVRRATPGAFIANALAAPLAVGVRAGACEARVRASCGGPTSPSSRRSCATCRSASTSTSPRASPTSTSASSRRAASCRRWTSRPRTRRSASGPLADLGWKDLLDGFTCTECGRCQEACPAWNTGKPLNPKTFIMGIRDMAVEAETASR